MWTWAVLIDQEDFRDLWIVDFTRNAGTWTTTPSSCPPSRVLAWPLCARAGDDLGPVILFVGVHALIAQSSCRVDPAVFDSMQGAAEPKGGV